jgi:hypothetical protein
MTKRKFHLRTVTIQFISEENKDGLNLIYSIEDAISGDSSMQILSDETQEVDGKKAAKVLLEQGSDSHFFSLTEKGEDDYLFRPGKDY